MNPEKHGWTFDKVPFKVLDYQKDGTVPVFQYHCVQADGWRFLLSIGEKPGKKGWIKDGIAFYAFPG